MFINNYNYKKVFFIALILIGIIYCSEAQKTRSFDLRFPALSWKMASTPQNAMDENNQMLFPEAELINDLRYGMNRAKLAWYNIDPLFLRNNSATPNNIKDNDAEQRNHYTREILQTEIFPDYQDISTLQNTITTFDLAFYPNERGPYNYENQVNGSMFSAGIDTNGTLKAPTSRWGGVQRYLETNILTVGDSLYIEFWVMDPFIYDSNSNGGDFYIQLGRVSEDIMRDGKLFAEHGLPGPNSNIGADLSTWGRVPYTIPDVNAFGNYADDRRLQDVGLDGLNDEEEILYFADFIATIDSIITPDASQSLMDDPSSDNFIYYRDDYYDDINAGILERYKAFNNPHGNSPTQNNSGNYSTSATNIPDSEDMNRDNLLEEEENYFQYHVRLRPDMQVGDNFIIEKLEVVAQNQNQYHPPAVWYHFKIPTVDYHYQTGNINSPEESKYIRMFLHDFEEQVVLRFARFQFSSLDIIEKDEAQIIFYQDSESESFYINFNKIPDRYVTVELFNMLGQRIGTAKRIDSYINSKLEFGNQIIQPGVYIVRVTGDIGTYEQKVLLH